MTQLLTFRRPLLALLLLGASVAWGQAVQPLFNYQGRLTDEDGVALEGFVTMNFSIEQSLSADPGASFVPIWQSTRVDVPLNDGFFSVNLGELEPLPTNILGRDLRMVLSIEDHPELEMVFRMTWSPFAVAALDSERLNGLDSTAYDQSGHLSDLANPHNVTAAQAGAVSEAVLNSEVEALNSALADKAELAHDHDELYFTETEVNDLLAALTDRVDQLEQDLQAVELADPSFGGAVRREGDDIIFEGVNVAIRNGMGTTDTVNGTGNLIVGYNLLQEGTEPPRFRTGSHNVVIGDLHSYRKYGALAVGRDNAINERYSFATGTGHVAYGISSVALGGSGNLADNHNSIVIGGSGNSSWQSGDMIVGGTANSADGGNSLIVGGHRNSTRAEAALIVGGERNQNRVANSQIVGRSYQTTTGGQ